MRAVPTMAGYGVVASLAILALCAGTAQSQSADHLQSNPAPAAPNLETNELAALNKKVNELRQAGKYAEALPLAHREVELSEKSFGPEHPDVANALRNLGKLYVNTEQYMKAEPLYQRVLAIWEKAFGPDHPNVASALNNLAELYRTTGQYARAELLYQRALAK